MLTNLSSALILGYELSIFLEFLDDLNHFFFK